MTKTRIKQRIDCGEKRAIMRLEVPMCITGITHFEGRKVADIDFYPRDDLVIVTLKTVKVHADDLDQFRTLHESFHKEGWSY